MDPCGVLCSVILPVLFCPPDNFTRANNRVLPELQLHLHFYGIGYVESMRTGC